MKNLKSHKKLAVLVALVMVLSAFLAIPMSAAGEVTLVKSTTVTGATFGAKGSVSGTIAIKGLEDADTPNGKFTLSYGGKTLDVTPTWAESNGAVGAVGTIAATDLDESETLAVGTHEVKAKYVAGASDKAAAVDGMEIVLGNLEITQAEPTVATAPTTAPIAFTSFTTISNVAFATNGVFNDNASAALEGTLNWKNPEEVITGAGNYVAVFTPTNTNYKAKEVNVAITTTATTVNAAMVKANAEDSITRAIKAGDINVNMTFDGIAAAITGSGIVPSYFGTVTYGGADGTLKPNLGEQTIALKIVVNNVTDKYALDTGINDGDILDVTANINVPAETIVPVYPAWRAITEPDYGTKLSGILDFTGITDGKGTFTFKIGDVEYKENSILPVGTNLQVVATFVPTANYQVAEVNKTNPYAKFTVKGLDVTMGNITTDLTKTGSVYQIDYAQDFKVGVTIDKEADGLSSIAEDGKVEFSVVDVNDAENKEAITTDLVINEAGDKYVAEADFLNVGLNIGDYKINAKYVPNEVSNYNEDTATALDAKINASEIDITEPDCALMPFGWKLSEAILANVDAEEAFVRYNDPVAAENGEFVWADGDVVPGRDANKFEQSQIVCGFFYDMEYVPKDNVNRLPTAFIDFPVLVTLPIFEGSPRRPIKVGESFVFKPSNDDQVGSNGWNVLGNENGVIDITFNSPATITAKKPGKVIVSYTDLDGVVASEVVEVVAADDAKTKGAATGDNNMMLYVAIVGAIALAGAGFVAYKKIKANKQ